MPNDLLIGEDFSSDLEHFGIPGMKWGVRRQRRKEAKLLKKASKARAKEWNKKYMNRSQMSDEDIRKATARLRLENDFAEQVKRSAVVSAPAPGKRKEITDKVVNKVVDIAVQRGANYAFDALASSNKKGGNSQQQSSGFTSTVPRNKTRKKNRKKNKH